MFDVPLRCDLHSKYEFIFHGDYYPTLTNFQADIETAVLLTGNLGVFLDEEFTSLVTNETYVETGIPLYVQSEVDMGSIENDLQLISCISSADELEEMAAVNGGDTWPLITEGCLVDTTVSMMPRGPDGEVRFNFESFKFQNSEDGHVVILISLLFSLKLSSFFKNFNLENGTFFPENLYQNWMTWLHLPMMANFNFFQLLIFKLNLFFMDTTG